jgi:flagellin-like protein
MKGITPIVSTILLLLITIAIIGLVAAFLTGAIGTSSESASESMGHIIESMATRFRLDYVDTTGDNLYIRNIGENTISELYVYVDGEEQNTTSESIEPGLLGILSIGPLDEGEHTINIISAGNSVEKKIDVPSKWVVELTATGEV